MILDVMLPGMDGFSVLQTIRSKGITVPVLMLTARSGIEDRLNGLQSGADYYLPKPFDFRELLACLSVITRRTPAPQLMELFLRNPKQLLPRDNGMQDGMEDGLKSGLKSGLSNGLKNRTVNGLKNGELKTAE